MSRDGRQVALLVFCFFLMGCNGHVPEVEFIVPVGFRGVIKVTESPHGVVPARRNGRLVYTVPDDGKLVLRSDDPFDFFSLTAQWADGKELKTTGQAALLHTLGSDPNSVYFFVGSREEAKEVPWREHQPTTGSAPR